MKSIPYTLSALRFCTHLLPCIPFKFGTRQFSAKWPRKTWSPPRTASQALYGSLVQNDGNSLDGKGCTNVRLRKKTSGTWRGNGAWDVWKSCEPWGVLNRRQRSGILNNFLLLHRDGRGILRYSRSPTSQLHTRFGCDLRINDLDRVIYDISNIDIIEWDTVPVPVCKVEL